jgi:hypothetical protein
MYMVDDDNMTYDLHLAQANILSFTAAPDSFVVAQRSLALLYPTYYQQ